MKIVKIKKFYRNGTKEHFLVLLDESYSNDDIDCEVEEWCESEPNGMNYGYSYEWDFVNDKNIINDVLVKKLHILNNEINVRNIAMDKIGYYMKQINKTN